MRSLTGRPRNAAVTTARPVRALVITARAFQRLLQSSSGIQLKVLTALAERTVDDGP